MERNLCDMNQLDCDSHLPPRKRLLAGFKKLNSNGNNNGSSSSSPLSPSPFASSSSTSNSNGSSSASTDVQNHLHNLLANSHFNNDYSNQSPEELVEATRSAAALAVKAAKAARAMANEKALISAKASAAAKRALELVDSFPKEAMAADCKERSPKKNKQKKHVPVELLYSKGQIRDDEEDLARRLHRAMVNTYPRVLRTCSGFEENGQRYKKQRKNKNVVQGGTSSIVVTDSMNDDIAGVVDSDSSFEGLERARSNKNEADLTMMKEKSWEESNSLSRRRGRVKLKKLPLSICSTRNQENNGTSSASLLPVAQPQEDGVIPVIPGSSAWKCQDLKAPECVKQNKAVRS